MAGTFHVLSNYRLAEYMFTTAIGHFYVILQTLLGYFNFIARSALVDELANALLPTRTSHTTCCLHNHGAIFTARFQRVSENVYKRQRYFATKFREKSPSPSD